MISVADIMSHLRMDLEAAIDLREKFHEHTAMTGSTFHVVTVDGYAVRKDHYGNYHQTLTTGMVVASAYEVAETYASVMHNFNSRLDPEQAHAVASWPAQHYLDNLIAKINKTIEGIKKDEEALSEFKPRQN